jgi:hypothetical protein
VVVVAPVVVVPGAAVVAGDEARFVVGVPWLTETVLPGGTGDAPLPLAPVGAGVEAKPTAAAVSRRP